MDMKNECVKHNELSNPCRECDNIKIIYYCEKFERAIEPGKEYISCPYGLTYDWQRGDALYTWFCPKCGNQLLASKPPAECPECNTPLGRKNVK